MGGWDGNVVGTWIVDGYLWDLGRGGGDLGSTTLYGVWASVGCTELGGGPYFFGLRSRCRDEGRGWRSGFLGKVRVRRG